MADYYIIVPTDDGLGWKALDTTSGDRVLVQKLLATDTLVAPSGVAFPSPETDGEVFWRTDEKSLYRWNASASAWELTKPDADGTSEAMGGISGNPHGFLNQTDTTIAFVDGTRTFTIAPVGADFTYFYQGARIVHSAADNIVIADTDGVHFIYYDVTDTLQDSLTPWNLETDIPVATVHWNTITAASCLGEERHTVKMEWRTHQYLHRANGTRYISGLTASGYVLNSDTDADVTIGVSDGTIYDEDIAIDIKNAATPTQRFEQILADPANIPVCYRQTALGTWRQDAATSFYFKNGVGGLISYNNWSGSAWEQQEAANGYHVAYWIVATNHLSNPVVAVQGQRQDNNLPDAIDNNILANMDWGVFPFQESKVLYRIILQTGTSFGGTRKVKVQDVTDYRSVTSLATGNFVPIDHSSLGGLATSGHPASVIAADTTNFDGVLSTADTTAQQALETLDDHRHGLKNNAVASASFAGSPRTAAVTFTTAYPDTNYSIALTPVTTNNTSFSPTVESKATTGFTINMHTNNITNLVEVMWTALPYGE